MKDLTDDGDNLLSIYCTNFYKYIYILLIVVLLTIFGIIIFKHSYSIEKVQKESVRKTFTEEAKEAIQNSFHILQ